MASYAEHVAELGLPPHPALIAGHTVTLYHCLPWLFSDSITGLSEEQHHALAIAGLLYFGHALLVDRLIDADDAFSPQILLSSSALHERALVLLASAGMLAGDSAQALRAYTKDYERAIWDEKGSATAPLFGWEQYESIAKGKAALLKAAPALMAVTTGKHNLRAATDEMVDLFNLAAQIHDDVKDWRQDITAGRPALLRALADLEHLDARETTSLLQEPEEVIAHWLFAGGRVERALTEASTAAARASVIATSIGADRWSRATRYYADRLDRLTADLRRTRKRVTSKATMPPADHDNAMGRTAVRWLAAQVPRVEDAHAHQMMFAPEFGFTGESPRQSGAVFCRAVLGWALNLAGANGLRVPKQAVDDNLAHLWAARRSVEAGGWSYFPDLPELPPDADDVGQVALACGRTGPVQMLRALAEARAVLLGSHVRDDGAIGTWLTDPHASAASLARYEHAIRTKWGRAFDPEVTANVVYGFGEAGLALPADVVRRAAAWVADRQSPDGSWESTWYVGPFYGTYVCTRFLAATGNATACARAAAFLRAAQRVDGGWGAEGSDSLATALALLAMIACRIERTEACVRRGIEYLRLTQRESGEWRDVPFIKMDLARAATNAPSRMLFHGSSLLTTAYTVAALAQATRD